MIVNRSTEKSGLFQAIMRHPEQQNKEVQVFTSKDRRSGWKTARWSGTPNQSGEHACFVAEKELMENGWKKVEILYGGLIVWLKKSDEDIYLATRDDCLVIHFPNCPTWRDVVSRETLLNATFRKIFGG
ncbi:hypothetical protein L0Y69_01870 [bacterium]|nr:hypothetical protein [bacterium]